MAFPDSGTDLGNGNPLFSPKLRSTQRNLLVIKKKKKNKIKTATKKTTTNQPKRPQKNKPKKTKGQKYFVVTKNATKNVEHLPQDTVYPSCECVCGNAVSMPTHVRLQHGKPLSHKFLVTENFEEKILPCICLSFMVTPELGGHCRRQDIKLCF